MPLPNFTAEAACSPSGVHRGARNDDISHRFISPAGSSTILVTDGEDIYCCDPCGSGPVAGTHIWCCGDEPCGSAPAGGSGITTILRA
jgi:hypothetical protein